MRTPQRLDHGALAEIKSVLAVGQGELATVFSTETIQSDGGFVWGQDEAKYSLLSQVEYYPLYYPSLICT